MGKSPTTTIEILHHLYSYLDQSRGEENDAIKHSIEELMKAMPNVDAIVETFKPYKDEVILLLIEALNLPKNKTFSLHPNALYVLGQIGDQDAVSLMLDKFDDYIERFNFSFTEMLTSVIAREGEKTRKLVTDRYIKYFIAETNKLKNYRQSEKEDKRFVAVLDSLRRMKNLNDPLLQSALERYARQTRENSTANRLALFGLAKLDKEKALELINKNLNAPSELAEKMPKHQIRSVYSHINTDEDRAFITLFIKEPETSTSQDIPHLFEFDKPLIYFFEDGAMNYDTASLVGMAEQQIDAIDAASHYLNVRSYGTHLPKTRLQECFDVLHKHFQFEDWEFQQSYIQPEKYPTIIYDSEWCRVKFAFDGSGDQGDPQVNLQVYYGRLHAPSNNSFVVLNKERYWCWHRVDTALNFLDGLSPQEAIKVKHSPYVIAQYRESDVAAKLSKISQAEWVAGKTSEIWKHYGQRLFEIFDLRYSDLWEEYKKFVNDLYVIEQPNSLGLPPYNKIH